MKTVLTIIAILAIIAGAIAAAVSFVYHLTKSEINKVNEFEAYKDDSILDAVKPEETE